jgi:hypothetical protein
LVWQQTIASRAEEKLFPLPPPPSARLTEKESRVIVILIKL